MAWLGRASPLAGALLLSAVVLSACGANAAVGDARTACRSVDKALVVFAQSQKSGVTASEQAKLQARALNLMLKAQPAAAAANSIDGGWNPLITDINEAERDPMKNLVASLARLCKIANSQNPTL